MLIVAFQFRRIRLPLLIYAAIFFHNRASKKHYEIDIQSTIF